MENWPKTLNTLLIWERAMRGLPSLGISMPTRRYNSFFLSPLINVSLVILFFLSCFYLPSLIFSFFSFFLKLTNYDYYFFILPNFLFAVYNCHLSINFIVLLFLIGSNFGCWLCISSSCWLLDPRCWCWCYRGCCTQGGSKQVGKEVN